jgi:hypothetical protein
MWKSYEWRSKIRLSEICAFKNLGMKARRLLRMTQTHFSRDAHRSKAPKTPNAFQLVWFGSCQESLSLGIWQPGSIHIAVGLLKQWSRIETQNHDISQSGLSQLSPWSKKTQSRLMMPAQTRPWKIFKAKQRFHPSQSGVTACLHTMCKANWKPFAAERTPHVESKVMRCFCEILRKFCLGFYIQ